MAVDLRRIRERVMGSRNGRREARRMAPKSRQKVVRRRRNAEGDRQHSETAAERGERMRRRRRESTD